VRPRRPGLIVHTFLPAGAVATRPALDTVWRAVAGLAMDQPISSLPTDLSEELPAESAAGGEPLVVLAARRKLVAGAIHEALAYRVHDVIAVSVLLAPNTDHIGWTALERQWRSVTPQPPAPAMGTVRVYVGQWPVHLPISGRRGPAQSRAGRLAAQIPGAGQPADWSASWCGTADGLLLWELPGTTGRRLLAMSEARDESVMDQWSWFSDGLTLPPLTRYLLHATRLRHQRAVLTGALPGLRQARLRAEDGCGALGALLRTEDPPVQEIRNAAQALGMVKTERGGLIAAWADVNDMAQTIRVTETNMMSAFGPVSGRGRGGPLDADQEIIDWMTGQLATESTYLSSAERKADEVSRLAAAVLDERQCRRREALALLQTSILGALLMALAAIQSFQYRLPLPGSLVAPLIALLAAAALVLPAVAAHWPDGSSPHRSSRRRHIAAAGTLGASAGWLAVSAGWRAGADGSAPVIWTTAGAAVAAAAVVAVLAGVRRRTRRQTSPLE
jgi:hypothetical protein